MFQRVREWFQRAGDPGTVIARLIPTWQANRPAPTPHDYRRFAEDGFRRNALIYSCVTEIAQSIAEPGLRLYRTGPGRDRTEITSHPLLDLLAAPNPDQTTYELLEMLLIHQHVAGNAYLHKVRARAGQPVQLWLLRPDRVRITPGATGMVDRFEFSANGSSSARPIAAGDVIHLKLPDPLDDYYGLSPIAVLATWGDIDTESAQYIRAFFLNEGVPSGFLKFKVRVPKEERERIQEAWREQHGGHKGWHTIGVIDADVDPVSWGTTPDKLRLQAIWDETESRICGVFGVPPIIAGTRVGMEHSTYANYRESLKSFWTETLRPMYRRIGTKLTIGLAREFDERFILEFDLSPVGVLQDDQNEARQWALDGWNAGVLTRNEARLKAGYPVQAGGDVVRQGVLDVYVPARAEAQRASRLALAPHAQPAITASLLDDPERTALWEAFARGTTPMEVAFARQVAEVLRQAEAALLRSMEEGQQDPVGSGLAPVLASALPVLSRAALPMWLRSGFERAVDLVNARSSARQSLERHQAVDVLFDLAIPRLADYLRDRPFRYGALITESMSEEFRAILAEQANAGASIPQMAEAVSGRFDVITEARAVVIARTEVISASNLAAHTAYTESGVVEKQEWLSSRDKNTRDTHILADEQYRQGGKPGPIRLNETFRVGKADLRFPADPQGLAEEVIQCRCSTLPVLEGE